MAVFAYRTEELSLEKIQEIFVETKDDRKIIE